MAKDEIQTQEKSPIQVVQGNLQLRTIDDLWRTAQMFVQSGLCPAQLDTPQKVVVALQAGAELGFKPWQSLQSLTVINGRVGLEGCAMLALVRKSKRNEYIACEFEGKPYDDDFAAVVRSKRRDEPIEYMTAFSVADAKLAKLWGVGKDNWEKYPKDMLTWRAVSRHCRRYYGDEISAMYSTDELDSIESQSYVAQPIAEDVKTGVAGLRDRLKDGTPPKVVDSTTKDAPSPQAESQQSQPEPEPKKTKRGRPKGAKKKAKEEELPPDPPDGMSIDDVQPAPAPLPEETPEQQPKGADKLLDSIYKCLRCDHTFDEPMDGKDGVTLCPKCFTKEIIAVADEK